jgi:hypothetical protein
LMVAPISAISIESRNNYLVGSEEGDIYALKHNKGKTQVEFIYQSKEWFMPDPNNAIVQIGTSSQGHIVFMDSSGYLKYYARDRQECITLDEGVYSDNRVMIKFNRNKDKFLFKKTKTCLQEYHLKGQKISLAKEYEQENFVIDDFLFAPAPNRKAESKFVLIVSGDGVMKICSCTADKERKFQIDTST